MPLASQPPLVQRAAAEVAVAADDPVVAAAEDALAVVAALKQPHRTAHQRGH